MHCDQYEPIKDIIVEAGKRIMFFYDKVDDIQIKADQSPLTQADIAANEFIVSQLQALYPAIQILSEESESVIEDSSGWCFIIDPLDGTKEFISRNGEFTVNIALVNNHQPVLGMIYAPVYDVLYIGYQGRGAVKINRKLNITEAIHCTQKTDNFTVVMSKSHSGDKEEALYQKYKSHIQTIKSAGSSLKGCLVAEGSADVYVRFGLTCEWDIAAMHCIVVEAGGIIANLDHSPILYVREDHYNRKGFYVINQKENLWITQI